MNAISMNGSVKSYSKNSFILLPFALLHAQEVLATKDLAKDLLTQLFTL